MFKIRLSNGCSLSIDCTKWDGFGLFAVACLKSKGLEKLTKQLKTLNRQQMENDLVEIGHAFITYISETNSIQPLPVHAELWWVIFG